MRSRTARPDSRAADRPGQRSHRGQRPRRARTPTAATRRRPEARLLEQGDIFFFYRPRVETEKVAGRQDVQRLFMVLAPERNGRTLFRLFVVGRKKLPQVRRGESHPEERNWAVCLRATSDPEDVRRELVAREYPTATRGWRRLGPAKPVGEGRYQLVAYRGHTELAYVLELPERLGPAQREFEIKDAASYVIAVKNPEVRVPGFPSPEAGPPYPEHLRRAFADRRWIEVDRPELLDYEGVQIVLLGARAGDVEAELGIHIDEETETAHSAELVRKLRLRREQVRVEPLFRGAFPERELPAPGEEVEQLAGGDVPGRGGRRGGRVVATRAPSAAALLKLLRGIDFPASKAAVVTYAERHGRGSGVEAVDSLLEVVRDLPDRTYRSMKDIANGLGAVR